MHPSLDVALRHLLMKNPRAGGHPLDGAGSEKPLIAETVTMLDLALENIGNGLDAAVRVPGKALAVGVGIVIPEVVQEQEGIAHRRIGEPEGAVEMDAGTFDGRFGDGLALDRAERHGGLLAVGTRCSEIGDRPSGLKATRVDRESGGRRAADASPHRTDCPIPVPAGPRLLVDGRYLRPSRPVSFLLGPAGWRGPLRASGRPSRGHDLDKADPANAMNERFRRRSCPAAHDGSMIDRQPWRKPR